MTKTCIRCSDVMAPQGSTSGMNQGEVAGAGIAAHLHQHVVPRWAGDANFLPIVARTKAMPELLSETRARLAAAWPAGGRRAEPTSRRVGTGSSRPWYGSCCAWVSRPTP